MLLHIIGSVTKLILSILFHLVKLSAHVLQMLISVKYGIQVTYLKHTIGFIIVHRYSVVVLDR